MELTEKDKDRYNRLPLTFKVVANALMDSLERLFNGDCDETQVSKAMSDMDSLSKGRYKSEDLLTYDQACNVLEFSVTNRVGLKSLLDKHGIRQVKIHNQKVGFDKRKVLELRDKLARGEK